MFAEAFILVITLSVLRLLELYILGLRSNYHSRDTSVISASDNFTRLTAPSTLITL